jgi:mono/diheme cytochrome c family protein
MFVKIIRYGLAIAAFLAIAAVSFSALFVYSGLYNVAATSPHRQFVYWLLQTTAVHSIRSRARDIAVPDLSQPAAISRGLLLFDQHCVQCHGAPGVPQRAFALGLEPAAPPLAQTAREWPVQDLYWAIRHGIKMTAMPAWEYRLADDDIWASVAFLRVLPSLSPPEYRAMLDLAQATEPQARAPDPSPRAGDPERGRTAFHQYACNMCHEAPGVSGPTALLGPRLDGLTKRPYLGGTLVNTRENMVLWIRQPQKINPLTAMPDLGVSEQHARDIAAFLYTLP